MYYTIVDDCCTINPKAFKDLQGHFILLGLSLSLVTGPMEVTPGF